MWHFSLRIKIHEVLKRAQVLLKKKSASTQLWNLRTALYHLASLLCTDIYNLPFSQNECIKFVRLWNLASLSLCSFFLFFFQYLYRSQRLQCFGQDWGGCSLEQRITSQNANNTFPPFIGSVVIILDKNKKGYLLDVKNQISWTFVASSMRNTVTPGQKHLSRHRTIWTFFENAFHPLPWHKKTCMFRKTAFCEGIIPQQLRIMRGPL